MLEVKVKKLSDNAVIPKYATVGSAGMDITATSILITDNYIEYGTGLSFEIPPGYCMLLLARSSVSNTQLTLCNGLGLLDSDYRGEAKFRYRYTNFANSPLIYEVGDRVGQMLIIPYPVVHLVESNELDETIRGTGGFGSTNV